MKLWIYGWLTLVGLGILPVRARPVPPDSLRPGTALGLKGGTLGLGLEVARRFRSPHWALRVGLSRLGYRQPQTVALNDQSALLVAPLVRLTLLGAALDLHPFRRSAFRLTAGLAAQLAPEQTLHVRAPRGIDYQNILIDGEEFGQIDLRVRWARWLPFAGLGLGRAVPRHRFGAGFDLGAYYLGPPRLRARMTGLIESTTLSDELPRIERNLSGYRYLPVLVAHLRYRLNR
jgi:hypothetical protein